jgi:hypothetical protein
VKIHLHIERLVLDGLPIATSERPLFQAAMEAELTQLLQNAALVKQLPTSTAFLRAPAIHAGKNTHPRMLGRAIAHAVNSGLEQSGRGQRSTLVHPSVMPSRSQPGGVRNE